jgi:hypothetical protein
MSHDDKILNRVKRTQKTVFRKAQDDLPLKAISIDSKLGYTTVLSHARGEAGMSLACFNHYIQGGLPTELLSMLLPEGFQVIKAAEAIDHDELARMAHDYLAEKTAAHCPNSPAGRDISDCEAVKLGEKAHALKAVAS